LGGEWQEGRVGLFDPQAEAWGYSARVSSKFDIVELGTFNFSSLLMFATFSVNKKTASSIEFLDKSMVEEG